MKPARTGPLDTLMLRRLHRRWAGAEALAARSDAPALAALLDELRAARAPLDALEHAARAQLQRRAGAAPQAPANGDWAWRPGAWSGPVAGRAGIASGTAIDAELTLFHDCPLGQIALRQLRAGPPPGAPFALALEVYGFAGSFLSLALALPGAALHGLCARHLVAVRVGARTERPVRLYARLNIRHGPNTATLLRAVPEAAADGDPREVVFDLAEGRLDDARIEHAWLDLILEAPVMNRVELGDVTLDRRHRAEM